MGGTLLNVRDFSSVKSAIRIRPWRASIVVDTTTGVRFRCPVCAKVIRAKSGSAGQKGKCPACQTSLRIPVSQDAEQEGALPTCPDFDEGVLTPAVVTKRPASNAPFIEPPPVISSENSNASENQQITQAMLEMRCSQQAKRRRYVVIGCIFSVSTITIVMLAGGLFRYLQRSAPYELLEWYTATELPQILVKFN